MPTFSGKYRYSNAQVETVQQSNTRLTFDETSLLLTPASGAPTGFDLGDIDVFSPGEYELTLKLYNGDSVCLSHFGKAFQDLCHDLLEAYRSRLVQCLLLEDLEEVARFDGWAQMAPAGASFSSRAEIRLYRSNLAVLPETAAGFSWRLADIDNIDFDEATYTVGLRSGQDRLILTRLAKRTRELIERLQEGIHAVTERGSQVIRTVFPFLAPDQFRRVAALYKEGHAVSIKTLNSIHPQIEKALLAHSVDRSLMPYLDILRGMAQDCGYFTGYKQIRREAEPQVAGTDAEASEAQEPAELETAEATNGPTDRPEDEILHWFFLPLKPGAGSASPANLVAWEATSRSGRATYFFRLVPAQEPSSSSGKEVAPDLIAEAVHGLNRAIVTLNFRREPIYLPDEALEMEERFRRYAIACRKMPVLRKLRASFLGRALHISPGAWQKQVQAIMAKA